METISRKYRRRSSPIWDNTASLRMVNSAGKFWCKLFIRELCGTVSGIDETDAALRQTPLHLLEKLR